MTAWRMEQTWCPLLQQEKTSLSRQTWVKHILTSGLDSHCDTGYLLYGDFCYYFETKMVKNWQDAEAHCTREQGHLASFHTEEELSFLIAHMPGLPTWIGLSDLLVENQYAWSDGVSPVLYTNWNDKEPNNANGDEGCVSMHASRMFHGTWNDTKARQNMQTPHRKASVGWWI
uniref:C-type lectin domain-containing protein n=1 Tax=Pundamilia nyererei TaxID=303518 RepID=A0A3B4FFS2_9CICH